MPAFTHHVLICGNKREACHAKGYCDPGEGEDLCEDFKKDLKKEKLGLLVRANDGGCMEQSEDGPDLVIYPQGIWYEGVTVEDVARIVTRTIIGGEVIEDLFIADSCLNNPGCPHQGGLDRRVGWS